MAEVRNRLPRELRDLIYANIWDLQTLQHSAYAMVLSLLERCTKKGECKERLHAPSLKPHFINPAFVGQETAFEIVEAWYKAIAKIDDNPLIICFPYRLENLVSTDPFHIGLDSATALRALTIKLDLDFEVYRQQSRKDRGESHATTLLDIPKLQEDWAPLLAIRKKAGFQLTIKLVQRRIRLKVWKDVFEFLKPTVDIFKKEGTHVSVIFKYRGHFRVSVERELNTAGQFPPPTWHRDAVKYFDKVCANLKPARESSGIFELY